ncbi:phosphatidylinositol-specific phospholipase C [Hyalangium minutum]|uniref:1-phosphatidylinositol phosphodiesterase n=1 Tax=Hyalangium minutum TaxID=394096 RepID=A0A085WNG0_9BACT|nr:phosphatidylinositol-specific phospholipase C [Hyalangium minutum]KFE69223.1 Phosphatidylinositol-specific phospholipase C [Hyalangium minutum]
MHETLKAPRKLAVDGSHSLPLVRGGVLLLAAWFLLCPPEAEARGRYYNHSSTIETSHPDWMSWVPGQTNLAALSLPGTHDTMSFHGGVLVQTQSMPLRTQLEAGIRVLDIRCRHIDDRFTIHHGEVYQQANFDDVLQATIQFLREHPTETVLMKVQQEHEAENTTRSFAETFAWYRSQSAYSPYLWTGTYLPSLDQVRGRIVILQAFSGGSYGVRWPSDGSSASFDIQDEWEVTWVWNIPAKWEQARAQFMETNSGSASVMYVNFLSGSSHTGGVYPYTVASGEGSVYRGTNDQALEYLVAGNVQRTGVVMMDFPGAGLIDAIIAHNFRLVPVTVQPRSDFDFIFKSVAWSFSGDAQERWNQEKTFLSNVLPGRTWQWMALKSQASFVQYSEGLSSESSEIDGYTHAALTVRSLSTAVSQSSLQAAVISRLPLLTGEAQSRAIGLYGHLATSFPFQSWMVVVKKAPGGLENWAYATYGINPVYKVQLGDYLYAVWGYDAQ